MSFINTLKEYERFDIDSYFKNTTHSDVEKSLRKDTLTPDDLLNLLAPVAATHLEAMAQKAQRVTEQYFGRTIGMYAPLYISDYCVNHCTYCGFNCTNTFSRRKLSYREIEEEARAIAAQGIRHILVLTGEAPAVTPLEYLEQSVRILRNYFSSIAIEIYPMDIQEYQALIQDGVDSLTIYQETYNREVYRTVHPYGKKADYLYRINTPERGAKAGFRAINIGALFGLAEPLSEAFLAGLHARYLEHHYPQVEISLSLPRMTKAEGGIVPSNILNDRTFVQIMLAWRLFMPRLGITISTREAGQFRDRLLHLGATRYSAGSKTDVGGYACGEPSTQVQFEVTDTRNVEEIAGMIRANGYQPIFKDWEII